MKKFLAVVICAVSLITLCSCFPTTKEYKIPEQDIQYEFHYFGNVIQDEKQAVFFYFSSKYAVTKIEFAGSLFDRNWNLLESFESSTSFAEPKTEPSAVIRINADIVSKVQYVSFSKIIAYTEEKIDTEK